MAGSVWREILEQVQRISGQIFATLNVGATSAEISLLEQRVGVVLPQAFVEYLATVNGQSAAGAECPLVGFRRLLGVAEIIEQMDLMESLFDATEVAAGDENKIRQLLWSPLWVPFAVFEGYDALILDLDPAANGIYGQIWVLSTTTDREPDDAVLADSFEDFSRGLLARLKERRFSFDDGVLVFEDYWSA